jgi:hypothetical protein
MVRSAYNRDQPGNAKKAASFIADVIKGERIGKEKKFTQYSCYNGARSTLTKSIAKFDEHGKIPA